MKSLFNEKLNKFSNFYTPKKENESTMDDKITFVLPLSGRYATFLRFLNNFEDVVLRRNDNVDLIISLFINTTDPKVSSVYKIVDDLNRKYRRRAIIVIKLYGEFSRGVAIDRAIQSSYIRDHDIIFLIDVDVLFSSITLERIRQNTVKHNQVYLPIVFSEYNPELVPSLRVPPSMYVSSSDSDYLTDYKQMAFNYQFYANASIVNGESGYFREYGYGLASIYKCDIMNSKINGFGITDIKGWGLEDVKFLEKILTASFQVQNQYLLSIAEGNELKNISEYNLNVFRSPDPSLVHIFHRITCDSKLEKNQYKMCMGTKSNTLGNFRLLKENYFLKRDFNEFASRVKEIEVH